MHGKKWIINTSLACLMTTTSIIAQSTGPTQIEDTFLKRDGVIAYSGRGWSVRSEGDIGWASLKVGADEFLYRSATVGGFLFSDQNPQSTTPLFPDKSNISHDRMVGHLGLVANGIHMIRFAVNPQQDDNELYFGANSDVDGLSCTMFLSTDVVEVRVDGDRSIKPADGEAAQTHRAVLVHRSGSEIAIQTGNPKEQNQFKVGLIEHPVSGDQVPALTFPTPGFKANPYRIDFGSSPRPPALIDRAMFDVYSSDDPADARRVSGNVAAAGVINPEYGPDTKLDYGVAFDWKGDAPFAGYAELEVIHAYGELHYYERLDLTGREPGSIRAAFKPRFTMPGVSEVWLRIVDGDNRMLWNDRYRMLYDRDNFAPKLLVEPDFDEFWDQTLAQLREIPLEPETTRVEKYKDVPDFEIYAVSFNGWDGNRMHAMLYVPRDGQRPLPAIISSHPGTRGFGINKGPDGVFGSNLRQDKRFVTITPLIRGHEIDAPNVPFNHPWWGPIEHRDTYVARSWYTAMVRAVDYLATRPELVDMDRLIAFGGSQGGALAIVTAALEPRIAYCFADCPSNAQAHEIMRYYECFGPSAGIMPDGVSREQGERILSYYNPANFAPRIRIPTHVGINIGDITVHSMGPLAIYHNLTGLSADQKAFHPGFTHFHGSGPGLTHERNRISQALVEQKDQ